MLEEGLLGLLHTLVYLSRSVRTREETSPRIVTA